MSERDVYLNKLLEEARSRLDKNIVANREKEEIAEDFSLEEIAKKLYEAREKGVQVGYRCGKYYFTDELPPKKDGKDNYAECFEWLKKQIQFSQELKEGAVVEDDVKITILDQVALYMYLAREKGENLAIKFGGVYYYSDELPSKVADIDESFRLCLDYCYRKKTKKFREEAFADMHKDEDRSGNAYTKPTLQEMMMKEISYIRRGVKKPSEER